MNNFVWHNPTKIIFGTEAMRQIADNAAKFGHKILLTYGQGSIKKNGIYDQVMAQLKNFTVQEFGGIEPNPKLATLLPAIAMAREFKPDLILAVGGGSVIDGSKLIAAAVNYAGDPWNIVIKKVEVTNPLPLAAVLTVAATGSEMDPYAVISQWETKEKRSFGADNLLPKFSILDPRNTFTVSRKQTAYGLVDIFSHVLEQYINTTDDSPLQDRFSEGILLTLIANASKVLEQPDSYQARANIMLCSTMALNGLIAMGVAEDWATHMIEHELSAFYDIPHGAGLAIITPRWMKEVKEQKSRKIKQLGQRVFGLSGQGEGLLEQTMVELTNFFQSLGLKLNLSDWGIDDKYFSIIVDKLVDLKIGEFVLSREQIKNILNNCLQ